MNKISLALGIVSCRVSSFSPLFFLKWNGEYRTQVGTKKKPSAYRPPINITVYKIEIQTNRLMRYKLDALSMNENKTIFLLSFFNYSKKKCDLLSSNIH